MGKNLHLDQLNKIFLGVYFEFELCTTNKFSRSSNLIDILWGKNLHLDRLNI